MKQIKFQHNWNNKLNNKFFTTIRSYNINKLVYYTNLRGKIFEVILKNKKVSQAKLIDVILWNRNQPDETLLEMLVTLDTGLEYHKAFELLKKFGCEVVFIILLFERVEKNKKGD